MTTDTLSADGKPTDGIGSLCETVSYIPFLGVATRTPPAASIPPLGYASQALETPEAIAPATPPPTTPIPNACVYSASATFWIEWVRNPGPPLIPLHEGPGEPCPPVRELEPY
jgi:hypothetical protein